MLAGMNKLSRAVCSSYGPKGRNTCFEQKYDVPLVTNDGYTIARQIELEDKFENMGASILSAAAVRANELSGDGTTAAVVIASAIINEAEKNIAAGANPVFVKKGIDLACENVVKTLNDSANKNVTDDMVREIATVSGNNDPEIGELICHALKGVGADGVVFIEDTQKAETEMTLTHGVKFDSGYLSRYFITDGALEIGEYKEPYILVCNDEITEISQIYKLMEETVVSKASLIIIAKEIKGEALTALALNVEKGNIKAAAIKCPGHGDGRDRNFEAIAAVCGATLIDPTLGIKLENCDLSVCGRAANVTVAKESTVIAKPAFAGSEEVELLKNKILKKLETETHYYEVDKLKSVLAILNSKMAVISVGGLSELEMFERKYRMEDALNAAIRAVNEGVLPGGGTALLQCRAPLEKLVSELQGDIKTGASAVLKSLEAPVRKIAENAGVDGSIVVNNITNSNTINYGYDAKNDRYGDMLDFGIIDPTAVIRNSFVGALSIASTYITTAAAICEGDRNEQQST